MRTDGGGGEEMKEKKPKHLMKNMSQLRVLFDVEETDHAFLDIKSGNHLLYENYAVTTTCAVDVGFAESDLKTYPP